MDNADALDAASFFWTGRRILAARVFCYFCDVLILDHMMKAPQVRPEYQLGIEIIGAGARSTMASPSWRCRRTATSPAASPTMKSFSTLANLHHDNFVQRSLVCMVSLVRNSGLLGNASPSFKDVWCELAAAPRRLLRRCVGGRLTEGQTVFVCLVTDDVDTGLLAGTFSRDGTSSR